jgi:hypothetical protein
LENPSATHEQATGRFLETDWRRLENIKKEKKKKTFGLQETPSTDADSRF